MRKLMSIMAVIALFVVASVSVTANPPNDPPGTVCGRDAAGVCYCCYGGGWCWYCNGVAGEDPKPIDPDEMVILHSQLNW